MLTGTEIKSDTKLDKETDKAWVNYITLGI